MPMFRKKPVVIEARLFEGSWFSAKPIVEWGSGISWCATAEAGELGIETLEGRMRAEPGDWIIKGVKGEFYPCKPDIFATTYEAV